MKYEDNLQVVTLAWHYIGEDRLRACEDKEYAARLEKGEDDGRDKS